MKKCNVHIAAFTLFEATVAITIIAIIIGLSTLIYGNVLQSEKPVAFYQAKTEVDRLFNEMRENRAFFSKNFDYETYSIEQKVEFHKGNKKLYQIDYTVTSGGKKLWTESHLVANEQDAR